MYWPDNEPFPEQGQIRPSNVVGVAVSNSVFPVPRVHLLLAAAHPEHWKQRSHFTR